MRTAIVGLGCVNHLGLSPSECLSTLKKFHQSTSRTFNSALEGFYLNNFIKTTKTYLDPASKFVLAAGSDALHQANFDQLPKSDIGVIIGTKNAGLTSSMKYWDRLKNSSRASPLLFIHSFINAPASILAIEYKLGNVNTTIASNGDSGIEALYWAEHAIKNKQAIGMLVGSVDTPIITNNDYQDILCDLFGTMLSLEGIESAHERNVPILAILNSFWHTYSYAEDKLFESIQHVCKKNSLEVHSTHIWTNLSIPPATIANQIPSNISFTHWPIPGDLLIALATHQLSQPALVLTQDTLNSFYSFILTT